jgi:hypothetical protein
MSRTAIGRRSSGMGESMFDKALEFAKDKAADNPDQVESAIDKLGDLLDDATGHKYHDQIETGEDKSADALLHALGAEPDKN